MKKYEKCIRVQLEPLKERITEKYGTMSKASIAIGWSKDALGHIFGKYKGRVEFPEQYLWKINERLGIEYRDLIKRNKPRKADDQICFADLEKMPDAPSADNQTAGVITPEMITDLIRAIDTLTGTIRAMRITERSILINE